jgi:transposase
MFFEPHRAWRHVQVTPHRTKGDFARCMQALVDTFYPDAERIRVVLDNLNTHTPAALYETFEPAQARRILRKLEFHFTPKHGSWLNMAELEFSILVRQALRQRIPSLEAMQSILAAWQQRRNHLRCTIRWQFSVAHARTKLAALYPA